MTTPLSSHGTLWAVQFVPGGAFTTVAELGDITPPEMSRNETDASVHNRNIDNYILGILRRGAFTVPLNFIPTDATHDHLTGLYHLLINNTLTGHRVTFPDGSVDGTPWIMSGQVQAITPTAPVDGKLTADVTMRFSGLMSIGGVSIGALAT
jgi:hypothetical protein